MGCYKQIKYDKMSCFKKAGESGASGPNSPSKKNIKPKGLPKREKIDLKKVTYQDMQAVPQSEEDLLTTAVYINKYKKEIVDDMVKSYDIGKNGNDALRDIYLGNEEEAIEGLGLL